ncbi:hypothetical protein [Geobacter pickeringii]|uniref:Uncharacterized protein n=1 Tax=Geobacter pickeringii TaxID=345632 RepID=A0A0B5BIQ1_9BACT|nr:hypothetical protein [Geobacter pickeringii]AJE03926.1 hypothetical protein GPICK_11700 [Geobacter pickeringii]
MKKTLLCLAGVAVMLPASVPAVAADAVAPSAAVVPALSCEDAMKRQEEALDALRREKALLEEKLKALECTPTVSGDELMQKNIRQLRELAQNTRAQRQSMADFEGFVRWMSGSLAGYEKYIQAGTVVAGFARVLPIPYAGQASLLTKFASQGILSLNATSASITKYLETSQKFLARVDAIDPAKGPAAAQLSDAARFADGELLRDMSDVQTKLRSAADISSSTLSFLESVNHYVGSTDEYWSKTKAFLARKDADKNDKSFLASSIEGLRNRAGGFNGKLKLFEETAQKDLPLIKNVAVYDGLVRELAGKGSRVSQAAR